MPKQFSKMIFISCTNTVVSAVSDCCFSHYYGVSTPPNQWWTNL